MKGHNITIEDGVTINYLVNAIQAVTEKSMAAFEWGLEHPIGCVSP